MSTLNRILVAFLILLLAGHIGVASIRHPVGPRFGSEVSGSPPGETLDPGILRVATYNIRRGKGIDGERDLDRIASNLTGFDVVGLNEVGGDWLGDQVSELGNGLGMGWLFAPAQRRWYTDYFGNGVLTRLPLTGWKSLPIIYDTDKDTGHRNLLYVEFEWQETPVTILVAHAERGEVRDHQIRHIFSEFSRLDHAILVGDLNAPPGDPIMQQMVATYEIASATGPGEVDWIFVRGFDVTESGSVPAGASDHPLMWATLELD